jgi:pimeloyl-ACP methyl ester carboxylesterase
VRQALIVPGAAVRRYVQGAVEALPSVGISGELLTAPGEPTVPADLGEYGRALARRLDDGDGVSAVIGLSVGAQVAAVAAATTVSKSIGRLILISPTVDPPPDRRRG